MHTAIPDDELEVFASLEDVQVVFDVGARDDVDYLILKPGIELHAFEPNPQFFKELTENVKDTSNVYLNNFGLGEKKGHFFYNHSSQLVTTTPCEEEDGVPVRRLDDYVREHKIQRIDFLKMDVEGGELGVLKGAKKTIPLCRYIQYEENRDGDKIKKLLIARDFTPFYIGGRNYMCVRKGEKLPAIPKETREGSLTEKSKKNYL